MIYSIHVSTNLILVEVLFFILKYCQIVELAFHIILINILCLPEDDLVIENFSMQICRKSYLLIIVDTIQELFFISINIFWYYK